MLEAEAAALADSEAVAAAEAVWEGAPGSVRVLVAVPVRPVEAAEALARAPEKVEGVLLGTPGSACVAVAACWVGWLPLPAALCVGRPLAETEAETEPVCCARACSKREERKVCARGV